MKKTVVISLCLLLFTSGSWAQKLNKNEDGQVFIQNVFHLSEVMLHDVANPPAASRFYAYSLLGAYQVMAFTNKKKGTSLSEKFKAIPSFQAPNLPTGFQVAFSASYAMLEVGKQLMPSGYLLEEKQQALIRQYKKSARLSEKEIGENKKYAEEVAAQVIAYAKKDGYNKLSTHVRYTPQKTEGHWHPTPPEYMGAVEPQWKTIRPFFLDSASQFAPPAPVVSSKDPATPFHRLLKEVYDITQGLTVEQRAVAAFWDCNPFAVSYAGHMAIGLKKISPGGHWMGITGIICRQKQVTFDVTVLAHTLVALTLHDAFISCWEEKYRSDRIRPESAINKSLDQSWRPLLQTPPFPEYPSGHSVASSAVAEVLSAIFGDQVSFIDTSEEYFGLPPRQFVSFRQAAQEAAISRLYGGIHFRDAIEEGQKQGISIAKFILDKTHEVANSRADR